ncbi:unnamed protein product, partial [Amoebophrya sp. A25]|eukprot:GSA25T00022048001.1
MAAKHDTPRRSKMKTLYDIYSTSRNKRSKRFPSSYLTALFILASSRSVNGVSRRSSGWNPQQAQVVVQPIAPHAGVQARASAVQSPLVAPWPSAIFSSPVVQSSVV